MSEQIFTLVLDKTWLFRTPSTGEIGWGNGYVGVPSGHPWFGKNYQELEDVDVHGGLTYSSSARPTGVRGQAVEDGFWWVGFDTAHMGDTPDNWTKDQVEKETAMLLKQAVEAGKVGMP